MNEKNGGRHQTFVVENGDLVQAETINELGAGDERQGGVFEQCSSRVLLAGRPEAQRCLPKMRGIEMKAGMTGADGYWLGAALSSYARGGNKWVYGAEYLQTNHPYRSVNVPVAQFTAEGGFQYNFLSDVKKTVFLYAGASALAGYETVNWGERTLYDGARLNNRDGFVYGCAATLDMELYLADFIALTASVRERFLWGGSTGVCRTEYGIGIKFIIN